MFILKKLYSIKMYTITMISLYLNNINSESEDGRNKRKINGKYY